MLINILAWTIPGLDEAFAYRDFTVYRLVSLGDEVRNPGSYRIDKGTKIYSLIKRAGGLKPPYRLKYRTGEGGLEGFSDFDIKQYLHRQKDGRTQREPRYR